MCRDYKPIEYPAPEAPLSTDILTSVSLTSTNHAEDQPVHLQLPFTTLYPESASASASATGESTTEVDGDAVDAQRAKEAAEARSRHVKINVGEYAGLLGRACPASVYEYVDAEPGEEGSWEGKKLVINSQVSFCIYARVSASLSFSCPILLPAGGGVAVY
jgi:electron-transferring-flavoprotein dehydrogenase